MERAGWLWRLAAFGIDQTVLSLIHLGALLWRRGADTLLWQTRMHPDWTLEGLFDFHAALWFGWRVWSVRSVVLLLAMAYLLIELVLGRSPGKIVLGLQIQTDCEERPVAWRRLTRWLVKHIGPVLVVGALQLPAFAPPALRNGMLAGAFEFGLIAAAGALLVLLSRRQPLHDRIAATIVTRPGRTRGFDPTFAVRVV